MSLRRLWLATLLLGVAIASAQPTTPVPSPASRPAVAPEFWLRTWVKVDDSFFTKHERNLFEESVGVHFRDLVGTHEAFVNGVKVAEGRIEHTQAGMFSADETADVGIDLGTPVVEAIGAEAKSRFTGRIPKVTVQVQ